MVSLSNTLFDLPFPHPPIDHQQFLRTDVDIRTLTHDEHVSEIGCYNGNREHREHVHCDIGAIDQRAPSSFSLSFSLLPSAFASAPFNLLPQRTTANRITRDSTDVLNKPQDQPADVEEPQRLHKLLWLFRGRGPVQVNVPSLTTVRKRVGNDG